MDRTELIQRRSRMQTIAKEMDQIVREIGPKWIRLAHLRTEAREIMAELQSLDCKDVER